MKQPSKQTVQFDKITFIEILYIRKQNHSNH